MKLSTRCFFDAAHRLVNYNGACKRLHGHSWVVDIEIDSNEFDEIGMVVDFNEIKKIIDELDHRVLLKECSVNRAYFDRFPVEWIKWFNENPTCEILMKYIHSKILNQFEIGKRPNNISVKVYESYKPEKKSGCSSD